MNDGRHFQVDCAGREVEAMKKKARLICSSCERLEGACDRYLVEEWTALNVYENKTGRREELFSAVLEQMDEARAAVGEVWFSGKVSLAEAIRRKTWMMDRLAHAVPGTGEVKR